MNTIFDPARRRVLGALATSPLLGSVWSSGGNAYAAERNKPVWAPAAGQAVSISYPAGQHPLGRGATLAEISPQFEDWNPRRPDISIYANGYGWHTVYGYCGAAWNDDTRQLVCYNSGHVGVNVTAPFCFDLNDLRWKWLDIPLPFDSLGQLMGISAYPTQAQVEQFYPPEQYNYAWGDVNGDWSGWPAGFRRPGKIQPLPSHTYGNRVCIPGRFMGNTKGGFLTYGSYEGVLNSSGARGSHLFDFDRQTWLRGANHWPGGAVHGYGAQCDKVSGKVIAFGGYRGTYVFRIFDTATRIWTPKNQTGAVASTNTDQPGVNIHEAARLFIVPRQIQANGQYATWKIMGTRYKFFAVSVDAVLEKGPATFVQLKVSEQGGWPLNHLGHNEWIGWSYCPEDRCLYAINGVHGSNKYWRLSPPVGAVAQDNYLDGTWTLTEHTFASGTLLSPDGKIRSMLYNRMNWDTASRSFVWFPDSINGPVQAWRPIA